MIRSNACKPMASALLKLGRAKEPLIGRCAAVHTPAGHGHRLPLSRGVDELLTSGLSAPNTDDLAEPRLHSSERCGSATLYGDPNTWDVPAIVPSVRLDCPADARNGRNRR